ncbi:OsmC-like protein [Meredithblackwellia eburnea MCA 4105]
MSLLRTSILRTAPRAVRSISSFTPIYTAEVTSTGSRASGTSSTKENNVSVKMGMPKEMGGAKGPEGGFSNPEQLFGMAYSTCYLSALGAVHGQLNAGSKPLPKSTTVRASTAIGKYPDGQPGFLLGVTLEVLRGPLKEAGLDEEGMKKLVQAAHELCPYSRAIKGNVEVNIKLADK